MSKLFFGPELRRLYDREVTDADERRNPSVGAIMAETRRELALFAAEMMGTQSYLGQFDESGGTLSRRQFRDLVEDTRLPYIVLDPRAGLHIIECNAAYGTATLTDPRLIAGERMFDVFPDDPGKPDADGVSNLFESLQRAAQTGRPHSMGIQRYDVRNAHGRFVERYWQPVNIPIFGDEGQLIYLLHHAIDVTDEAQRTIGAGKGWERL